MKPGKSWDAALGVIAAGLGLSLSLHYGRIGFMPLDQSIVFDGGWRVLSGQVPFRDFTTPSGAIPILLQALFFKLLGVSWLSYCLHAAIANGLFCAVVYGILRLLGGARLLSFGYGLLSGVVFYPPFGVPYMDQHAFFFGTVAVLLAVAAARVRSLWVQTLCLAGLPLTLLLAYLSKQIPAIFFLPLLALPLWLLPGQRRRTVLLLGASAVTALGVTTLLAGLWQVEARQVLESFVLLPGAAGEARHKSLTSPGRLLLALGTASRSWGLLSVAWVHLSALGLGIHLLRREPSPEKIVSVLRLLLAEHLLLTCTLFTILTKNEPENSIPCVFLALGLVQISLAGALVEWPRVACAVATALAITAALDAYGFNARVNRTRLVLGLEDTPPPAATPSLPAGLDFLRWREPSFGGYSAEDLSAVVAFLRENPGNFLLVGDASILYGLTGRPSLNPALWFHPRLTIPGRATSGFQDYEQRLIGNLRRHQVRYVVVEMNGTFMGTRPAYFPALVDHIQARIKGRRSFGSFDVIELGAGQERAQR
jgi:hypothetical protein